jgi:hypothetical protein
MSRNQAFRLAGEIELQALQQRIGYRGGEVTPSAQAQYGRRGEMVDTEIPALLENKYHNVKTNGYASRKEATRAEELKLLFHAGQISDLVEQPEFVLVPPQDGERAVKYRADFGYYEKGQRVIEDCKGVRTSDYIIKRKLMLFLHGIRITET